MAKLIRDTETPNYDKKNNKLICSDQDEFFRLSHCNTCGEEIKEGYVCHEHKRSFCWGCCSTPNIIDEKIVRRVDFCKQVPTPLFGSSPVECERIPFSIIEIEPEPLEVLQ